MTTANLGAVMGALKRAAVAACESSLDGLAHQVDTARISAVPGEVAWHEMRKPATRAVRFPDDDTVNVRRVVSYVAVLLGALVGALAIAPWAALGAEITATGGMLVAAVVVLGGIRLGRFTSERIPYPLWAADALGALGASLVTIAFTAWWAVEVWDAGEQWHAHALPMSAAAAVEFLAAGLTALELSAGSTRALGTHAVRACVVAQAGRALCLPMVGLASLVPPGIGRALATRAPTLAAAAFTAVVFARVAWPAILRLLGAGAGPETGPTTLAADLKTAMAKRLAKRERRAPGRAPLLSVLIVGVAVGVVNTVPNLIQTGGMATAFQDAWHLRTVDPVLGVGVFGFLGLSVGCGYWFVASGRAPAGRGKIVGLLVCAGLAFLAMQLTTGMSATKGLVGLGACQFAVGAAVAVVSPLYSATMRGRSPRAFAAIEVLITAVASVLSLAVAWATQDSADTSEASLHTALRLVGFVLFGVAGCVLLTPGPPSSAPGTGSRTERAKGVSRLAGWRADAVDAWHQALVLQRRGKVRIVLIVGASVFGTTALAYTVIGQRWTLGPLALPVLITTAKAPALLLGSRLSRHAASKHLHVVVWGFIALFGAMGTLAATEGASGWLLYAGLWTALFGVELGVFLANFVLQQLLGRTVRGETLADTAQKRLLYIMFRTTAMFVLGGLPTGIGAHAPWAAFTVLAVGAAVGWSVLRSGAAVEGRSGTDGMLGLGFFTAKASRWVLVRFDGPSWAVLPLGLAGGSLALLTRNGDVADVQAYFRQSDTAAFPDDPHRWAVTPLTRTLRIVHHTGITGRELPPEALDALAAAGCGLGHASPLWWVEVRGLGPQVVVEERRRNLDPEDPERLRLVHAAIAALPKGAAVEVALDERNRAVVYVDLDLGDQARRDLAQRLQAVRGGRAVVVEDCGGRTGAP